MTPITTGHHVDIPRLAVLTLSHITYDKDLVTWPQLDRSKRSHERWTAKCWDDEGNQNVTPHFFA